MKLNKGNTIETMSPERSHSDDSLGKLSDDSIESITNFHLDHNKSKTASSDLKGVFSDEFKFLPKSETNNTSTVVTTKKVENKMEKISDFDENDIFIDDDSFLPTPTQDESQSPMLGTDTVTRSKQSSTSVVKSSGSTTGVLQSSTSIETNFDMAKDSDFYDPELPLQSPDHSKSPNIEKFSFESTLKSSHLVSFIIRNSNKILIIEFFTVNFERFYYIFRTVKCFGQISFTK